MNPRFPDFDLQAPEAWERRLKKMLPSSHWLALETVYRTAQEKGENVLLVGGIVRDLLLGRENLDVDFVCLQDARLLARALVPIFEALPSIKVSRLLEHSDFMTARIYLKTTANSQKHNIHIDFATARREVYLHPAALPTVETKPASLEEDLKRRDFTINAMALSSTSGLVDPFNGLEDLKVGLIKILHSRSFEDDPTRMVRAARFAARYGYQIEMETRKRLEAALLAGYFSMLSAERKRNELSLVLKEARPEKAVGLLENLGLLKLIHPALEWNETLRECFVQLRQFLNSNSQPDPSSTAAQASKQLPPNMDFYQLGIAYLAALLYTGGGAQARKVVKDLRFSGLEAVVPAAVAELWEKVRPQLVEGIKHSTLYSLLKPYEFPPQNLRIFEALLYQVEPKRAALVNQYWDFLSLTGTITKGNFLIENLGLAPGPHFKDLLAALRNAVLDGEIEGQEAQEAFLRRLVQRHQ